MRLSLHKTQTLIIIMCERELMWLDMIINVKKSCCIGYALGQETIIQEVI